MQPKSMSPAPAEKSWPTAEEEKHRRLFNEAQDRARRVQAAAALASPQPPQNIIQNVTYQPPKPHTPSPAPPVLAPSPQTQAPPAVNVVSPPPAMNVVRPDSSRGAGSQMQNAGQKVSAGASLYQSAMMAVGGPGSGTSRQGTPANGGSTPSPPNSGFANASASSASGANNAARPPHLSAEEEKAQMRYLEAKRAVAKRQRNMTDGTNQATASPTAAAANDPLPYDVLYPSAPASSAGSGSRVENRVSTPPASSMQAPSTPPSGGSHSRSMSVTEDGFRRQLNPLDAIASLRNNIEGGSRPAPPPRRQTPSLMTPASPSPGQVPYYKSPLAASTGLPSVYDTSPSSTNQPPLVLSAEEEKARLAARYAEVDSGGGGGSGLAAFPASPQPAAGGGPPGYSNTNRPLDATEEKARLAAAYAADDQLANTAPQVPEYGAPPPQHSWQAPPTGMHSPSPPQGYPQQYQQSYGNQGYPHQQQGSNFYTSPTGMTSPLPQQNGTLGQNMAAPVATRPPMPAQFQSQGSALPSSAGGMQTQPEALYQSPEGYYSAGQQGNGYYAQGGMTGNGNGNGHGYHNELDVPYGGESPSTLRRDPSISQGKRRAMPGEEPGPPPPLAPKPPAEYIQETELMSATGGGDSGNRNSFGLEIRPVSPLDLSFDQQNMQFERPPLPPKLPI